MMLANSGSPAFAQPRQRRSEDAVIAGKLLIVEDEFLIGEDLSVWPQREGIEVVGPFNTISGALDMLDTDTDIGAAIVDINIRGQLAFELADRLMERKIPFVFYTGYESMIVPDRFRGISRVRKPAAWADIKRALFDEGSSGRGTGRLVKEPPARSGDLAALMPVIQQRSREITSSQAMADRLVERTLERAIGEIAACPPGLPMTAWLLGLLETTGIGEGSHLH
jgi:CheY-like chemotaxis protein